MFNTPQVILFSLLILEDICHALSLMVQQSGLAREPAPLFQWYSSKAGHGDLSVQLPCFPFGSSSTA